MATLPEGGAGATHAMTTRPSAGGGALQAGFTAIRQWPVLLLPGITVHTVVIGLMLPRRAVEAVVFGMVLEVFRGWDGIVLGILVGALVLGLTLGIPSLLASAVVVVMAPDALAGRAPDLDAAIRTVTRRLLSVIGLSIVALIVVSLGFLLLVVPGIIAGIGCVFALPAVLLGRASALSALGQSVRLVGRSPGAALGLGAGLCVWLILLWVANFLEGPAVARVGTAGIAGVALTCWSIMVVRVYQRLVHRFGR